MLICETKRIISEFSFSIAEFEIDDETVGKMVESLKDYGRSLIEKKAREEAGKVLLHMKNRFSIVFSLRAKSMSSVWTRKEDVRAMTKDARLASLKVLAIMAALRLDETPDKIESTLSYALLDAVGAKGGVRGRRISSAVNALASSTWEGVSPPNTLIIPVKCASLWRQFMSETEYIVGQAQVAQEARVRNASWLPSLWVVVALMFLGFNELIILLRNPLYLLVVFSIFLLFKALSMQLDILGLLRRGISSGIASLSSKLAPMVTKILNRSGGAEQKPASSAESDDVLSSLASANGSFEQTHAQDAASVSSSYENSCTDRFEQ